MPKWQIRYGPNTGSDGMMEKYWKAIHGNEDIEKYFAQRGIYRLKSTLDYLQKTTDHNARLQLDRILQLQNTITELENENNQYRLRIEELENEL